MKSKSAYVSGVGSQWKGYVKKMVKKEKKKKKQNKNLLSKKPTPAVNSG